MANDCGNPAGKLADAELHYTGGDLDGLKLIGFSIWERRGRNVTFPARQYSVNGERRAFALLRPIPDAIAQDRVRDQTLAAYASFEQEVARTSWGALRYRTSGDARHPLRPPLGRIERGRTVDDARPQLNAYQAQRDATTNMRCPTGSSPTCWRGTAGSRTT